MPDWKTLFLSALITIPMSILASWIYDSLKKEQFRVMNFITSLKRITASVLLAIGVIIGSFILEFLVLITVKAIILPDTYFAWENVATSVYLIYSIVFVGVLVSSCWIFKNNFHNRKLRLVCLYVLWLSFPTYTHWEVDVLKTGQWGVSSFQHVIIVPHVLCLENLFSNIEHELENPDWLYEGKKIDYNVNLRDLLSILISSCIYLFVVLILYKISTQDKTPYRKFSVEFYIGSILTVSYLAVTSWF